MKSSFLCMLGVGLPLITMMVLWQYLAAPANAIHAPVSSAPAFSEASKANPPIPSTTNKAESALIHKASSKPTTTIAARPASRASRPASTTPSSAVDATELLRQGRHEDAVKAFDRLLVREPDNPLLITGKAMALNVLGRHDDALPLLENLARKTPDNASVQFNYAVSLMRTSERANAVAVLRRVLQLDPTHAQAMFNLAALLQATNQSAEALQIWRKLTDGDSPSSRSADERPAALPPKMLIDAWFHRGEVELDCKHPAEAEKCFLRVTQLDPRNAQAWCNVGIAQVEQFRRAEALTALSNALRIDPDLVPALNQTAFIQAAYYRDIGDPAYGQAVVDCCRRSLKVNPNQPNIAALERAARRFDPEEDDTEKPTSDK